MHCSGKILAFVCALAWVAALRPAFSQSAPEASPPLPSLKTVMDKFLERAKGEEENDRAFQAHYAYKRAKVNEERNADGKLEKRNARTSQHLPAPGKTPVAPATPNRPQTNASVAVKSMNRKDFTIDKDLLTHFQFNILRREMLNGRPALVLDFKPVAKPPPVKGLKDHFLNKAAGRLWVDEVESVLVRTDVHLLQAVSIVAGLVGSVNGFRYHFDRERTEDGLWFTKNVKLHVELRELLVHKILDYAEESVEVRRVR